jgi:hypothetical protein
LNSYVTHSTRLFSPNLKYCSYTEYRNLYQKALHGNVSKLAFLISEFDHQSLNTAYMDSLQIMKSERIYKMVYLSVSKRNPILKHLDRLMAQLIPSGIPKQIWDLGYWEIFRRFDVDVPDSRRILALSDVEFGFVIWLATFPIPILFFICELFSLKAMIVVRKLAGLFEFLRLLRARMSVYHD